MGGTNATSRMVDERAHLRKVAREVGSAFRWLGYVALAVIGAVCLLGLFVVLTLPGAVQR